MTGVLLDTSAYSALRRGHPEIARVVREADRVVINAVVLGELWAGFRKGGNRRRNEEDLKMFLESPRAEVAPIDENTAERYAVIVDALREAGSPIPTHDVWIAACAMEQGLALVTTDEHFTQVKHVIVHCFPRALP